MKIGFYTLGCKVNQYETASLKGLFHQKGYQIVEAEEEADIYVVNSCTVTHTGDKKSLQMLRRFRRAHPQAVLVLTGCFPQAFPEKARQLQDADLITGTSNRADLPALIEGYLKNRTQQTVILPHNAPQAHTPLPLHQMTQHTRAYVKLEEGCQRSCSYCIIPTARGPVRSKPLAVLTEELKALVARGFLEVVLVGVNLSSYGLDLPDSTSLADAVELADRLSGIQRVRLGSLEPDLLDSELLQRLAKVSKLCPQFHLSLQSGCDDTLQRMRRLYSTHSYQQLTYTIRQLFPNPSLTTDVMVGFPGETEREFQQSLQFVQNSGFAKVHVFPFSPRCGTPAYNMPHQLSTTQKQERTQRMLSVCTESRQAFIQTQIGKTASVLFERQKDGRAWGYTANYLPVAVVTKEDLCGQLHTVQLKAIDGDGCIGVLI